ncbi:hypothetical protein Bbelb_334410 [Branchiostoma belcheri]|nr:hypothetical protein Bbelb_334410 [Branchiostoma belcheri]
MDFEKGMWSGISRVLSDAHKHRLHVPLDTMCVQEDSEGRAAHHLHAERSNTEVAATDHGPVLSPRRRDPGIWEELKGQATCLLHRVHGGDLGELNHPSTAWIFKKTNRRRTNNDVEGWQNGLNKRAAGKFNLPLHTCSCLS